MQSVCRDVMLFKENISTTIILQATRISRGNHRNAIIKKYRVYILKFRSEFLTRWQHVIKKKKNCLTTQYPQPSLVSGIYFSYNLPNIHEEKCLVISCSSKSVFVEGALKLSLKSRYIVYMIYFLYNSLFIRFGKVYEKKKKK